MIYGQTGGSNDLPKLELSKFDKRKDLEKQGFVFYKSLKAGNNSTYSFKKNGHECAIGFDSIDEAVEHVIKQHSNGKNPFMIF